MKKVVPIFSAVDGLPIRKSGAWITRKYHYLRRYLDILSVAMKKKFELTYIDLFAGPGRCLIEDAKEELDGSALIALGYDFKRYIFVEQDAANLDALKKRCRHSEKFDRIEFVQDDCNQAGKNIRLSGLAVAFIDPTGIDFHFDTIRSLTMGKRVDLLMTIMDGMDIKRNLERYLKEGDGSDLERFLGCPIRADQIKTSRDVIRKYREQLKSIGYDIAEAEEAKDIMVTNQKNVPLYFLMFASKHPKGKEFWKKISVEDEKGQRELFL